MNRLSKNEKGVTLVELLAVMVIGGIVMVLIMSIFSNGQKQYNSQTAKVEELNDVRYAAKVITKEIRKAEKIKWDGINLIVGSTSPLILNKNTGTILKDGKSFTTDTKITNLSLVDRTITISMDNINANSKVKPIDTKIYIREGVIIE